jgi:DNA helicase HerA-like ATPase
MSAALKERFPGVHIEETVSGQCLATTSLRLASVLDLAFSPAPDAAAALASTFSKQVQLLSALKAWPSTVNLRLDVRTIPDLAFQRRGRLETVFSVTTQAGDPKAAIAEVLSRTRVLTALMSTHLPDYCFESLGSQEEIASALKPFVPRHCVSIGRRRRTLCVAWEDGEAGQSDGIGFLPMELPPNGGNAAADDGAPQLTLEYQYPLHPASVDISTVIEALLSYPAPLWLHVLMSPHRPTSRDIEPIMSGLRFCEELLSRHGGVGGTLVLQATALRKALTERLQSLNAGLFLGGVFLSSPAPIDEAMTETVGQVISPMPLTGDEIDLLRGGFQVTPADLPEIGKIDARSPLQAFTALEAACALRLPRPVRPDCPGITVRSHRTILAQPSACGKRERTSVLLGNNEHQGYSQELRMSPDDRMRHWFILGQTGAGKSAYLEETIVQDIQAGRGVCVVDPHGDLYYKILTRYPDHRLKDLVLLNLLDEKTAFPFNILQWKTPGERDLIIDELLVIFDQIYSLDKTGGPIFELHVRGMLRLLLGDKPREGYTPTILEFPRLFQSREFRGYCAKGVEDPQILAYLKEAEHVTGEAGLQNVAPYITSKFSRFLMDTSLRRIVGQERMGLDFSAIMREGKVLLVNLGKARYGELASSILASQIVARFKAATLRRAMEPPASRRDFFFFVDEFQNLASENFVTLFAEARKYRMSLIVANQYADQLDRRSFHGGGSVLDAIVGNVGTTIAFRLGAKDAALLEPVFHPTFSRHDLANLPNWQCYVRQNLGREKPVAVSMQTVYNNIPPNAERVKKMVAYSQRKYAVSVKKADQLIEERWKKLAEL